MASGHLIEIDGSFGEGGGQILRNACTLYRYGEAILIYAIGGANAGFTAIGERGLPMERVVEEAMAAFQTCGKTGFVDEHLADQLVPMAAVTTGMCTWTTSHRTDHLDSVIHLIGKFGCSGSTETLPSGCIKFSL